MKILNFNEPLLSINLQKIIEIKTILLENLETLLILNVVIHCVIVNMYSYNNLITFTFNEIINNCFEYKTVNTVKIIIMYS